MAIRDLGSFSGTVKIKIKRVNLIKKKVMYPYIFFKPKQEEEEELKEDENGVKKKANSKRKNWDKSIKRKEKKQGKTKKRR